MATFDENGNYIKTDWKAGDKITAAKLNKIEESIEAVNNNDISRHMEVDARLDQLESISTSGNQGINAKVDALEDVVEANKDATDLEIYNINAHMTLLDKKIDDGVADVEAIANTVDGKIAAAETNMNDIANTVDGKIAAAETNMLNQVNRGKADMEAMVAEVEGELEQKTNLLNNRIEVINNTTDTKGTIDLANFAQQGLSSPPIGVVVHHYTDGVLAQFDNVGEGNDILVLKNAQNSTRRADKDESFVGSGSFLRLTTHNDELGYAETNFLIDKNAELIFTKSTAVISQNKEDDGLYAYVLKNYKAHNYIFSIMNADNRVLSIINDVALTRLAIQSDTSQTNGMYINSKAGNIRLDSAGGWIDCINKIRIRYDANTNDWKTVARIVRGTSADRPTDFEIGECYFDVDLNKPIWRNKTNDGWVDATGNPV